jgi:hypothetical protein
LKAEFEKNKIQLIAAGTFSPNENERFEIVWVAADRGNKSIGANVPFLLSVASC